ncbi:Oidioi.mRNA.OKI2018_I69.XSR.g16046.t1.cds [Oikopleura dioica]|uniref:Oidioi.mRNA.OKI2018_I69.XSR.g16046.t1.cds n=1 Tax=Oikopleura dioica TaxID=34765 RepID=A0ABN7SFB9_OIKDI|nr:Oidioi.mRNA.OKI2018_I69.XSR.g16046.t1.cds [Oikopleura dioica]
MSSHGQTLGDRLAAARHVIDGSTVNKAVVKATTHEVGGPKKKHLDYLVQLTGAPNVNLPELANQIVERTRNSSWVVVFKALVTCQHLMIYGNERFLHSCASRLQLFSLQDFNDRSNGQGYEMSAYVRRYARYLNEKSASYRSLAYDFTRMRRSNDGQSFKTMNTETLLKTVPVLEQQLCALIDFDANAEVLTNAVIKGAFVLLFKDLVRLFACYHDGIINLLDKYFEMKKAQCKKGLDIYDRYLERMDKVQQFFKVAEKIGLDQGDTPDFKSAPASLRDALKEYYESLDGKKSGTVSPTTPVSQSERDRVIEQEKKLYEQFSKNKQSQSLSSSHPVSSNNTVNLMGTPAPAPQAAALPATAVPAPAQTTAKPAEAKPASSDLLDLDMSGQNTLNNLMAVHSAKQQQNQNIMAQFNQPAAGNMWGQPQPNPFMTSPTQQISQPNPFQSPNPFTSSVPSIPMGGNPFGAPASNPFANPAQTTPITSQFNNMSIGQPQLQQQQNPFGATQQNMFTQQPPQSNPFAQDQSRNQPFSLLD